MSSTILEKRHQVWPLRFEKFGHEDDKELSHHHQQLLPYVTSLVLTSVAVIAWL
jgi:hypothetical protein